MSVLFSTSQPKDLLKAFKEGIDKGKIHTWAYAKEKDEFYHTDHQTKGLAWFRASINGGLLVFNIVKPQGQSVSDFVYAYYHGHLIDTFIFHFKNMFTQSIASGSAMPGDDV